MMVSDYTHMLNLILPHIPLTVVILAGTVYALTRLNLGAPAQCAIGAGVLTLINIFLGIAFQTWMINSGSLDSPTIMAYGVLSMMLGIASWVLMFVAVFIGRTEPIKKELDGYRP